jgi:hypothetical protein
MEHVLSAGRCLSSVASFFPVQEKAMRGEGAGRGHQWEETDGVDRFPVTGVGGDDHEGRR